jgi:hypothetical protein
LYIIFVQPVIVESGVPPLSFRINIFLNYATDLATNIFAHYRMNTRASINMTACLHQLIQWPKLHSLPIMPTPPRPILRPTCYPRLVRHNREVTCNQCLMRSFPSNLTARMYMYNLQVIRSCFDPFFFRFSPIVILASIPKNFIPFIYKDILVIRRQLRQCHFLPMRSITALRVSRGTCAKYLTSIKHGNWVYFPGKEAARGSSVWTDFKQCCSRWFVSLRSA